MEPMTLGSAPSSPSSPGVNPFLPNFLMGDAVQPHSPSFNVSPGRNPNTSSYPKLNQSQNENKTLRQRLFNQSLNESGPMLSPFVPVPEKAGPPKQGLFDMLEQKKNATSPLSSTRAHFDSPAFNESLSRINEESLNFSRNISSSNESLWVTAFGFPPSQLTFIISQLANCGAIVDKKIPSQGNWVHVKYNNVNEVMRALALNGKCLNNTIMIGVHRYHNKENKENENNISMNYTSPRRPRSLRQSFVSPSLNNSVIPPQSVPQKSTGIVTKAIEYVFGW